MPARAGTAVVPVWRAAREERDNMSEEPSSVSSDLGISSGRRFVMTASFEDDRAAVLVEWVQQCAQSPPMVCVALHKGRPIEPVIRDSGAFALCEIPEDDLFLERALRRACEHDDDVLESIPHESVATGSPCITRGGRVFDCQVMRHIDFEADYEIYIAEVVATRTYAPKRRASARHTRRRAADLQTS
jgi:flavin reductase (DIM6/NTAB) family NADH-FMN oxidoreductase RutF